MSPEEFKPSAPKHKIARRFVIYIVLLSSLITLLTTAFQLLFDYRRDIDLIESHIEQIRSSHINSITDGVWVEDEQQINSQLDGLVRYADMEQLSITVDKKVRWQAGVTQSKRVIKKQMPLIKAYRGKSITIGKLNIVASVDSVLNRLIDKAIIILLSNALKTFIVAGFILLLFQYMVARHLHRLDQWARSFDITSNLKPIVLNRKKRIKKRGSDEFDVVVSALNEMQKKIQSSYGQLKDSHINLEKEAIHSREILNLHLEKTPLAAITWDEKFRCLEWNPSAEQIFGFTRDEAIGKQANDLIVPEKLHTDINAVFEALLNQKGGSHNINENVTKNGETILCEWFNTPIKSGDGTPVAVVSMAQDITQQQQYKTELIKAKEEAESANRTKSDFLSNMSHELRTPLNAILGFGQLLEMTLQDDLQKKNAEAITKAGQHLLELINEILDLSKIEAGHLEWLLEDVHLNSIIDECQPLIQPLATEHNIQLNNRIDQTKDYILHADYRRCKQIVLNLLSNAFKYNRPNGSVTLSCEEMENNSLRISITDTGPGIAEDKIPMLFEPFNRMDAEHGKTQGTGIGIVITQQLVELMGGKLGVISTPGKGSTFWFEILLSNNNVQVGNTVDDVTPIPNYNKSPISSANINILVAEDNKTNQEVLRQQLSILGYSVDFADNGIQALDRWNDGIYQLLMTDIHMPDMDGFELVNKIRKTKRYIKNNIPIIAITADAMQGQTQRYKEAGMDNYLTKPVDLEALQALLSKCLPERSNEQHPALDAAETGDNASSNGTSNDTSNAAIIDSEILADLVGNDPKKHLQLLKCFIQSTPEILKSIQTAITQLDAEKLQDQAHKLKSSSRSMGANTLLSYCLQLENAARDGAWDDIKIVSSKLEYSFKDIEDHVSMLMLHGN